MIPDARYHSLEWLLDARSSANIESVAKNIIGMLSLMVTASMPAIGRNAISRAAMTPTYSLQSSRPMRKVNTIVIRKQTLSQAELDKAPYPKASYMMPIGMTCSSLIEKMSEAF